MNKFDSLNWRKLNPVAVPPGAKKQLKGMESSLLLVRWTRAKHTPALEGVLEGVILSPFGTPATPSRRLAISDISDYYEFWQLQTEGLPYTLTAQLDKSAKHSSQLVIWEFLPLIVTGQSGNTDSNLMQLSNNQGINIVSYTPPAIQSQVSNIGTPKSTPATLGAMLLRGANATFLNGFGTNNTNKTVWISFSDSPIAARSPAIAIGAGGNFDIEQGYQGVIQGFIAQGGAPLTGSIDLLEFNAV